jgi:hypothetical protein
VVRRVGKAFSEADKAKLIETARAMKTPYIYPALMIALNAGLEIRGLIWEQVDLANSFRSASPGSMIHSPDQLQKSTEQSPAVDRRGRSVA